VVDPHLLQAWDRFFLAYDPFIRKLAFLRSPRIDDRLDRVQEIWCVVIVHFGQYDPERAPLRSWLTAVVRHVLADQDRYCHPLRCMRPHTEDQIVSPDPDPASVCEFSQARERVVVAMAELRRRVSEVNYQIMHDHWFEESSFAQIAVKLGFTVKQVRDRHQRAMAKLRDLLSRER
jgi:RNA polymerase sigma-70 factor (ECF subfamily)